MGKEQVDHFTANQSDAKTELVCSHVLGGLEDRHWRPPLHSKAVSQMYSQDIRSLNIFANHWSTDS